MQFLAFIFVGIVGVFLGLFVISGLQSGLENFSGSLYPKYTYESYKAQRNAQNSQGLVLGESVEVRTFSYPNEDIRSVLGTIPNTSRFQSLFTEAGGGKLFAEPTLYTLFVSTDAAFSELTYEFQVRVNTMTDEEVERYVAYHVVPQKMVAVDGGIKAGTVTAVSRDALNFELRKGGGTVGNAHVVATYNVKNGIIYVIDGVLLPPEKRSEF